MKNKTVWTPRVAAAKAISGVLSQHHSLAVTLPHATQKLEPADRALAQEISYGVLRHIYELEGIAKQLLKRSFKNKDGDLHALILSGIYQLHYMRTPDHAALSETVNAVKILKKEWASGVVNAVLRRFQRESESLTGPNKKTLAEKNNHPDWMVQKQRDSWPQQWRDILHHNIERPPMTLRVNLQQGSRDAYLQLLQAQQIEATPSLHSPTAITLSKGVPVGQLPGFEVGKISIQDEAPQQSALLLDPQPGERILDACAAPGGKTAHLLEQQSKLKELIALDRDGERLKRVEENLQRIKATATLIKGDAALNSWWDGTPFDRILVDAPCSATGVIRRNPDIKLLRRRSDIATLVELQNTILENCWGMLQQGGTLLYATCSIFPEENEQQIAHFLKGHPDARVQSITLTCGHSTGAGHQLLPGEGGMDGFYYALLQKGEEA